MYVKRYKFRVIKTIIGCGLFAKTCYNEIDSTNLKVKLGGLKLLVYMNL